MGLVVKLRRLKTTIISSLFIFSSYIYANVSSIKLDGETYIIETQVNKMNRAQESRIATMKAKVQLARFLKKQSKSIIVDLQHFIFVDRKITQNKVIYRFKIDKNNIEVIK